MKESGIVDENVKIRPHESLKRNLYNFQTKRYDQEIQGFGPPLPGQSKWLKLDPNELLVHNMRSLDHLDDVIEDKMRETFVK